MEERFSGRRWLIGLGVLAIVGLCVMVLFGMFAMLALRPAVTAVVPQAAQPQVAPPAGQTGAVPQPYYGYAPWGGGFRGFWGPFGFLFGLGRILLTIFIIWLIFRIIRRLFWRRCCWGRPWGGPWGPPPGDQSGQQGGPASWRWHHRGAWGPPPWARQWGQPPEGQSTERGEPDWPPRNV